MEEEANVKGGDSQRLCYRVVNSKIRASKFCSSFEARSQTPRPGLCCHLDPLSLTAWYVECNLPPSRGLKAQVWSATPPQSFRLGAFPTGLTCIVLHCYKNAQRSRTPVAVRPGGRLVNSLSPLDFKPRCPNEIQLAFPSPGSPQSCSVSRLWRKQRL